MRVLVYKRTHNGDPDEGGCFGARDCMGSVRARNFDAVVGVGGLGTEAVSWGIARKVSWIGIGTHKRLVAGKRGPEVTFDRFLDLGADGPELHLVAPNLARHVYSRNIRAQVHDERSKFYDEIAGILAVARNSGPSTGRRTKTWGCKPSVRRALRTGCRPRKNGGVC